MVVGRIIEVHISLSLQEYPYFQSLCNYYLQYIMLNIYVPSVVELIPHYYSGAAKALESGDVLSSGLCPTSLLRQPPWRCVGESCCHGDCNALCQAGARLYLVSFLSGFHAQEH